MLKLVVLSCVVAVACASVVPLAYTAPLAYSLPIGYTAPLGLAAANYRGPLSLAPGQPANILAADGRPLDTLDVNLDRSAHYVARALNGGVHVLKKRSAQLIAPITTVAHAPLIAPAHIGINRIAPITRLAPYTTYPAYTTYW